MEMEPPKNGMKQRHTVVPACRQTGVSFVPALRLSAPRRAQRRGARAPHPRIDLVPSALA